MLENMKLTREQVIFLTFIGVVGNIVYIHTWIDNNTDRSAWVAAFLGILALIPFAIWILRLGKDFPGSNIFDIFESFWGKFISRVFCLVFILINIALAITQLNMFTEMLRVFFLQYTPSRIILLVLVLICTISISKDIIVFARLVEILGVLGILNYLIPFLFAFTGQFHIKYIIPIFDSSAIGFIKGTIFMASSSSECLLLLFIILKFIPTPDKHFMWVVKGIGLSAVIFSVAIMIIMAMMSPELASRIAFGGVNAAKLIEVGAFLRGLEVFVFGSYQFIAIGKTTLYLYCIWTCSKKIFGDKKPKLQLTLAALIIFIFSVLLNSYNTSYFMAVFMGNYILFPFVILILLLVSIGVMMKKYRAGSDLK